MAGQGQHDISRDGVQYSMLPSRGYNYKIKSFWRTLIYRHASEDKHVEKLYRIFTFKLQIARLRRLLAFLVFWSTLMCVLNFVFESEVTLRNICYVILVILFVIVLLLVHTQFAAENRIHILGLLVLFLCLCLCVTSFPVNITHSAIKHYSPADGVWQTIVTVFIIYTLIPVRVYIATFSAIALVVAHTAVAIFLADTHEDLLWRQITGNLLLFASVNVLGIYIHDKTEHSTRKVFHQAANCITARIEAEEENSKLEKLLCSILPHDTAKSLKKDLLSVETPDNAQLQPYVTTHDNVSILHANIIGVTELAAQCTALELVHILNEIIAKFDALTHEKHCSRLRVQGDVYSCMSGHADTRPDHATCCVNLAVNLNDFLREIRDGTELELYTKIGIHTGHVTGGIVGNQRWSYDVYSQDVQTSREVMQACTPGKVLISQATFEYLQGEYDVEPANVWSKNRYLHDRQMETFYIVPAAVRKPVGVFRPQGDPQLSTRERLSYRNMSRVISLLVNGLRPRAEMPFAQIVNTANRYPGDANSLETKDSGLTLQREKLYRYLTHAVMSRALDKSKSDWLNMFTLRFHHSYKEKRFQKQEDASFPTAMLCSMVQLVLLTAIQATVLPRTLLLLLIFLTGFTWIAAVLIVYLGTKLRVLFVPECMACTLLTQCVDWDVQKSVLVRLMLFVVTMLFIHLVSQVNVLCCHGGAIFNMAKNHSAILAFNDVNHLVCSMPHYIYLSGVASLLTLAIFFKMAAWMKLCLILPMVVGYLVVIEYTHAQLFKDLDLQNKPDMPSMVEGPMALVLMGVLVYVQGRLTEWTLRLGFLWKDQAMEERIAVSEFQNQTRHVVINMFPSHIALHFVDFTGFKHSLSTYGHSYLKAGLCCVSIPNFLRHFIKRTFNPNLNNNNSSTFQGLDAFMVLNDIIKAFDQLLKEDRFSEVDKIRSSGASYMVAVGLAPERPMKDTNDSIGQYLTILVEFVQAMKEKLKAYNEDRRTHFQLRAGLSVGPLTVGVVGSRQPVLDVWGYTVYLANLMEATGKGDCIQVTSELVQPLATRYEFQRNSPIFLNGRGETCTHFLTGRKILHIPEKAIYSGKVHLQRQSGSWKQSPFGTPIARFKQLPSDSSINTSGYITQPHTAERSSSNQTRLIEPSREVSLRQARESPTVSYGIRIQGLQRTRMASDESNKTMTPPSSLNRRRLSGSFTGSDKIPPQQLLQPPPLDATQTRMASPDLPLVHFQRSGGSGQPPQAPPHTQPQTAMGNLNTLTQSQILNQGGEGETRRFTPQMGYTSPFMPVTNSNHGNQGANTSCVISPRRSATQTPSSARSSAETVRSVQISEVNQIHNENSSSLKAYNQNPHGVIATQNATQEKISPVKSNPSNLSQRQQSLVNEVFDATGSEIAEMDNILRELGCTSSTYNTDDESRNKPLKPATNFANLPKVKVHHVQSSKVHVHSGGESSSQQISEYENDELSDTMQSNSSKIQTKPVSSAKTEDISFIPKPNYVTSPYGKPSMTNMDMGARNGQRKPDISSSKLPQKTENTDINVSPKECEVLRLPYHRYMLADDSSSTSSGVCGIPRMKPLQILRENRRNEESVGDNAEPDENESPPPLPPPPSMEALYGRRPPVGQRYHHRYLPHHHPYHQQHHHDHLHRQHNQHLHLHGGSAFRPVLLGDPLNVRQKARPVGPVRPIPAINRGMRAGMSTMSSNTSDETMPAVISPRRRPKSEHRNSSGDKSESQSRPKSSKPDDKPGKRSPPKSKTPDRKKTPVKQDSVSSDRSEAGHVSDDEAATDSTLNNQETCSSASKSPHRKTPTGKEKKRPPAPPFQIKRRQHTSQPVRKCRSLDYIPSDIEDAMSASSRAHSPTGNTADDTGREPYLPITHLIKTHVIGDNISISSFESGSEMSRSDPALNYDSSSTNAYESEYDNYRPGMASDEDYFAIEPVSDVDLELFDDINLEEVTVSDKYDIDVHDFINMNSMTRKQITEV